MTLEIKHNKVSTKPDSSDPTKVNSSDWNALHTITAAAKRLAGRFAATAGALQEIIVGFGLFLSDDGVLSTAENVVTSQIDSPNVELGVLVGTQPVVLSDLPKKLSCLDVVSGSGLLNGTPTDSGQTWGCTGAGYLSTSINAGGWIEGTENTYCHVNTGSKISKAVQYYSGSMATIQIGLDSNLTDMIHCNFNSGGDAAISYWKTGVGSALGTQWGVNSAISASYALLPNLNDDTPHKLELHVHDCLVLAYCDGVLCSIVYDAAIPSITGNWMFAQIHGAGEKIYSVEAYTSAENSETYLPVSKAGVVDSKSVTTQTLTVGIPGAPGFSPSSSSYFWTDDEDGHVFGGSGAATVKARSEAPGNNAKLVARCYIGIEVGLVSVNDGSGSIQHQDADKIKFPFNTSRIDMQNPTTFPAYTVAALPSATVPYQRAFVSDATSPVFGSAAVGGGAAKTPVYSDGSTWIVG